MKKLETFLFFETPLARPYGVWIAAIQWITNHMLYSSYVVLPDFKWGIITDDTTFNGVKR